MSNDKGLDKKLKELWGRVVKEDIRRLSKDNYMPFEDFNALIRVVRAAEKIYETTGDGYMFKHILVEGEGDKWHIPEAMGLALAEALKTLPEHLRGEG